MVINQANFHYINISDNRGLFLSYNDFCMKYDFIVDYYNIVIAIPQPVTMMACPLLANNTDITPCFSKLLVNYTPTLHTSTSIHYPNCLSPVFIL